MQLGLPSPVWPALQAHKNDPGVFVHVASAWQKLSNTHSLISTNRNNDRNNVVVESRILKVWTTCYSEIRTSFWQVVPCSNDRFLISRNV